MTSSEMPSSFSVTNRSPWILASRSRAACSSQRATHAWNSASSTALLSDPIGILCWAFSHSVTAAPAARGLALAGTGAPTLTSRTWFGSSARNSSSS